MRMKASKLTSHSCFLDMAPGSSVQARKGPFE
jgi:hypothetical protein